MINVSLLEKKYNARKFCLFSVLFLPVCHKYNIENISNSVTGGLQGKLVDYFKNVSCRYHTMKNKTAVWYKNVKAQCEFQLFPFCL